MRNGSIIKLDYYIEDYKFYVRLYRRLVNKYGKKRKIVKKVYKYMKNTEKKYNKLLASLN